MFLCEILTEQQQQVFRKLSSQQPPQSNDEYEDEDDVALEDDVAEVVPFQEILPIKKYYLIGKLKELKSKLDHHNIQNTDFDTIIKFVNSLSYGSLVSLASGVVPVVEEQLARLTTNV